MEFYLYILTLSVYVLFMFYATFKSGILSEKTLPKEVKYKYKLLLRFKAMFFQQEYWVDSVQENDAHYFFEFNKKYRNYLKSLIKATVIYFLVLFFQFSYLILIQYI